MIRHSPHVPAGTLLDHGLDLLPEPGEPRDPVVDVGEVLAGDGVGLAAGAVGLPGEVKQGLDVLDLEAELPACRMKRRRRTSAWP